MRPQRQHLTHNRQPRRRQLRSFVFWQRLCLCWFLSLTLGSLPALPPAARAEVRPEPAAKPAAPQSNVDLTVAALDAAALVTDSQTLVLSGTLGATIKNLGSGATNGQFRVIAFEDRNGNGVFNQGADVLIGSTNFSNSVAAGASADLSLALSGMVTFKGNLIYVFVDSENAIAETNENNNILPSVTQVAGGVVNLSPWQVVQYRGGGSQPFPAIWSLEAGNTVARQTFNSDPSIFLGDFVVSNEIIEGTLRVEDNGDDDYIGFAFGYQDSQHLYVFQWHQEEHPTVPRGMTVRVINADSPLTVPDFESVVDIGNRVRVIYRNSIPWAAFTTYQYALAFSPGQFSITIKQGNTVLASTIIQDNTYLSGRFGFYNYSQEQVVYSASRRPQLTDLTASFIRSNPAAFPTSSELTARIGNGGGASVPAGVKVSFYRSDPAAGGALIGTTQTSRALAPGEYEDVKVVWNNPPTGLHPITVIADDNGSGQGTVIESNETNNKAMANIALGIGPFTLVDDLLARFKDGAVDLQWSPIAGATGYNVYRRTGNGAPQLIKQNQPRANFADAGLTNGTTYYYTVRWVSANNIESGDGTEMSATPTSQNNRNDVPPTILSAPVTRTVANTPYSYDANARDPNSGDTLSYQFSAPQPEALRGMTINAANGLIQWTAGFASAGYQNVTVRVADSRGRFATQTYRLFVEIPNTPPLVNAGPDRTIMATETANLLGTVLDDGLPFGGTLTTVWSKVSGPGAVMFANPSQPQTTAIFSAQGTYVLRLAASDSALSASDDVTINVVRPFASRLYTLNADFDQGSYTNVEHRIPHQLQLGEQAAPFPFIWVAVSSKGSVVKLNTETGQVLGEYWTSPDGQPKNPSRTTVDLNGNVWVANRDGNSITRIGLRENGQCIDRNGNGRIDTSTAQNDLKAWTNTGGADTNGGVTTAQDECIINYVRVSSSGTRHLSVNSENDVWVSGTGNQIFNLIDGRTGQIKRTEGSVGIGGYGGLIDKNNTLWSTTPNSLLRWNTSQSLSGPDGQNWRSYGFGAYGLGIDSQGNVWTSTFVPFGGYITKIKGDGTVLGTFSLGEPFISVSEARGVAVDRNDHIWTACSRRGWISHLKNDGTFVGLIQVFGTPTGVAVDSAGKIWVTNLRFGSSPGHVVRINPAVGPIGEDGVTPIGAIDFTSGDLGGDLYNYSDMTGSSLIGAGNTGAWTVVYDSQIANAEWGRLSWNAQVCGDGALTITAASSTDNTTFSAAQNVTRGQDLTVPNGRYLRISALFRRASTGESPILYDLAVGTEGYAPPAQTNAAPVVDAGADLTTALFVPVKLKGSACDDGLPNGALSFTWSKVSGPGAVTFANANALATTATINTPGTYVLRLTASDSQATASDDINVTIEGANGPPVITSTAPASTCSGRPYSYQVIAADPNFGDVLTYSLPTAPAGMAINPATGLIQWTPTAAQVGSNSVKVRVTDLGNNQVEQSFTVNIAATPATNTAPRITSTAPTSTAVGLLYTYQAAATDPDPCETLTWSLDVAPAGMTISAAGLIQWMPSATQTGNQTVTVRARDFSGVAATQTFTINVVASLQLPTVAISAPTPGSAITQLVNIVGTIGDPNGATGPPVTWQVELRREGSSTYKTIGSGTGPVTNGALAPFDPTMLANDVYYVRLSAVKGIEYREIEAPYSVTGELKLGNFTISFTDLTLPLAGLPIAITRSYDSLDTAQGEFGAGWRLGLAGNVRDAVSESPLEAFHPGTRVYVTRPDGRRVGFTFAPYRAAPWFPGLLPAFTPDPGVYDTLTVADDLLIRTGNDIYQFPGGPYNPDRYFLKTKENITYEIDESEGLKKITDTNGNTLTVTPTGIVSSTGVNLAFQRDARGRIEKITEPTSTAANPRELKYGYDAKGNLESFTDQDSKVTKYRYEEARFPNYLTRIEDPLNRPISRNVFNAQGRLIGVCDANGNPTTLAGCVKLDPNVSGKVQTIFNARGFRTDLILDDRGNVLTERRFTDGANFLDTVRTYDGNDNMKSEKDPAGNTKSFTYDGRGNVLTATDPASRVTTYTYHPVCNKVATVTDPAVPVGNVTTYEYDDKCNLRFVKEPLGRTTEYKYNPRGQRSEMIDPVGNRWMWGYDNNGFLQTLTDPFGKAITFNFNTSGELRYRIDRNNKRIDFGYDAAHRLRTETWNTTPQRVTTYGYNDAGQLTSAVDPDSALTIDYFPTGLVKFVDNVGTPGAPRVVVNYQYDENGNVKEVQDSLGGVTAYKYDALDRLERVTQAGTGVNEKRVDLVYDNASFLRELRRFSNLAGTQGVANTFFDYDCGGCAGRVKSIHHRKASNNAVIHDLDFQRDALGDIRTATDAEGAHNYGYDELRRLRSATHSRTALQPNETYTYDAAGNRLTSHLSSSYVYSYQNGGKGNRLTKDARFDYQYDDEGNLIRKTERATGSYLEYQYDYRNRLVEISQRTSVGNLQSRLENKYDALGRRIRTTGGNVLSHYIYEGLNPVMKVDSNGQITNRRMYAIDLDEVFADELAGETRWLLTDQLGTVRDLLNNSAVILNHYAYDSFGQVLHQSNPSAQNDILFSSREFGSFSDIGYFRSRFYQASQGRFMREDPLEPYQYEYADNNPGVYTDKLGLTTLIEYYKSIDTPNHRALISSVASRVFLAKAIRDLINCAEGQTTQAGKNQCVRTFFRDYALLNVGFFSGLYTSIGFTYAAIAIGISYFIN